jgi:hypothetical protein
MSEEVLCYQFETGFGSFSLKPCKKRVEFFPNRCRCCELSRELISLVIGHPMKLSLVEAGIALRYRLYTVSMYFARARHLMHATQAMNSCRRSSALFSAIVDQRLKRSVSASVIAAFSRYLI